MRFLKDIFKHQVNKKVVIFCQSVSSFVSEQFADCGDAEQVFLPTTALPSRVFGDEQRLKQILVNLLFNKIWQTTRDLGVVRIVASYDEGQQLLTYHIA